MPEFASTEYWSAVRSRANDDGEFRRHAKFWTATVRLGIGAKRYRLRVDNGALAGIERWPGGFAVDLAIDAPEAGWRALLAQTPRPFYQDLYPATIHHGFDVAGDAVDYCAYYPALRRLIEIMRACNGGGEGETTTVAVAERANAPQFDAAVGRYVRLPIDGTEHRIYFEEAGTATSASCCSTPPAPTGGNGGMCSKTKPAVRVPHDRLRSAVPRQVRAADGRSVVAGGIPPDAGLPDGGAARLGACLGLRAPRLHGQFHRRPPRGGPGAALPAVLRRRGGPGGFGYTPAASSTSSTTRASATTSRLTSCTA